MKNWKLTQYSSLVFEKTGLIPRSLYKFFIKIKNEFDPVYEYEILKNFRISKYQTIVFSRYIFTILFIPFLLSTFCKKFVFVPIIDNIWDKYHLHIFLNVTQEKRAYEELQHYHNQIIFKNLLSQTKDKKIFKKYYDKQFKEKAKQIAKKYISESKNSIINIFTNISFLIFFFAVIARSKKQEFIFKSFIQESFYGLSDTARAFLIILFTDIFVGFHSSHGWQIFLETILRHFGFPEDREFIFIFVATLPVILDAIFKYWVFRYLNRFSPSTVATYKTMNE